MELTDIAIVHCSPTEVCETRELFVGYCSSNDCEETIDRLNAGEEVLVRDDTSYTSYTTHLLPTGEGKLVVVQRETSENGNGRSLEGLATIVALGNIDNLRVNTERGVLRGGCSAEFQFLSQGYLRSKNIPR